MRRMLFLSRTIFLGLVCTLASCRFEQNDSSLNAWKNDKAAFIDKIMSDTATLSMDLTSEANLLDIRIVNSPDNKVRVYSWISGGGTSPEWTSYTQYRDSQGNVKVFEGVPIPEEENYGTVTQILQADNIGDKTLYLVNSYGKASSIDGYESLVPMFLDADTFALGPKFRYKDGGIFNSIGINYDIPDWYFRANNGEGWDWLFDYFPREKEIMVALVNDNYQITDQYEVFRYDGENFTYVGTQGPWRLNPSIREFELLETTYLTEQHIVRVDRMNDSSFRLALWTNPSNTSTASEPDLIIYDGKYDEYEGYYIFRKGKNTFYVPDAENNTAMQIFYENKLLFEDRKRSCFPYLRQSVPAGVQSVAAGIKDEFVPKLLYILENHVILIDSLKEEGYRYVSWRISEDKTGINETPALELYQGRATLTYYIFENGNYEYFVPKNDTEDFLVMSYNEIIGKEQVRWSYNSVAVMRMLNDNF